MKQPKNTKLTAGSVAEEIAAITDRLCAEHLDAEYGALCRKAIARLARKRPSPLLRGEPRTWAAGIIYTIGMVNFVSAAWTPTGGRPVRGAGSAGGKERESISPRAAAVWSVGQAGS